MNDILPLSKAFLYPTMHCNLNCRMCYSKSGVHSDYSELDIGQYRLLTRKLYEAGVRTFDISGGEPFLRTSLYEIVSCIKELKDTQIFLVSNGTLINDNYEECAKVIRKVDRIQISLDSVNPGQHNDIRQSTDAFERTAAAIERLAGEFAGKVGINTVIMNSNREQVVPILNFALEHGIEHVSLLRYIDVAENKSGQLSLEDGSYSSFAGRIAEWSDDLKDNMQKLNIEIVLPGYMYNAYGNQSYKRNHIFVEFIYDPIRGCHAFGNNIVITHSGNITGCTAFVKYSETYCGNILEDEPAVFTGRYLEFKNLFKKREAYLKQTEPCRSCDAFPACRGGCPAAAYKEYHHFMYPDPTCFKNLSAAGREVE